jgi:heat shock protein HtpX
MANYYPAISKAIAALPDPTIEARQQVYDRAFDALSRYLKNAQPPLTEEEMQRELAVFADIVKQIEVEFAVDSAIDAATNSETNSVKGDEAHPVGQPQPPSVVPIVLPPDMTSDATNRPALITSVAATIGMRAHIRANSFKSIFLVVGFPFVLPFVVFCVVFLPLGLIGDREAFHAAQVASIIALVASLVITLVWLPIAYFINQWIIDRATGARLLTRSDDVRVWRLLETLCTQCEIRMPTLRVIETGELNAYASGLSEATYSVTVTKGLMATLNDAELEGVLAHELTHIINRDVRLTVVATILVGVIPLMETIFIRGFWYFMNGLSKLYQGIFTILPLPGAVLMIRIGYGLTFILGQAFAIIVGSTGYLCSLILNFSLSRRREFMADVGAVSMTNNADAMISALRKISGHSDIPATFANMREMFFDNPRLAGFEGFFATHPSIESRINALLPFSGSHANEQRAGSPPSEGSWSDRAPDFMGAGFLICAIATMCVVMLTAKSEGSGPSHELSRPYQQAVVAPSPRPIRAPISSSSAQPFVNADTRAATPTAVIPSTRSPPSVAQSVPYLASSGPSFDCAKAARPDERRICNTPILAALDVLDTQAFRQALQINHDATLAAGRQFISARRACLNAVNCISARQSAVLKIYRALGATVELPR